MPLILSTSEQFDGTRVELSTIAIALIPDSELLDGSDPEDSNGDGCSIDGPGGGGGCV